MRRRTASKSEYVLMAHHPAPCPISGHTMKPAFQGRLLGRHAVEYFLCGECGLLQTEEPHWLDEAYGTAIARTDIGLVQRNADMFRRIAPLVYRLHGADATVLDAAGGYGMLTRLLRDHGFDAYTQDEHCENLLAGPFGPSADQTFDVLCAIEVMEHLVDPRLFLTGLIERHEPKTVIFSTLTYDGPNAPPPDWWYYAPETGQHITFFQPRTIRALASALGFVYTPLRRDLHLLTRQPLGLLARLTTKRGLAGRLLARGAQRAMRGRSRLAADYELACRQVRTAPEKANTQ